MYMAGLDDMTEYAELHALSNFTFLRGASHPEELVEQAHVLGYRSLALTDECSVAGLVRAHIRARDLGFHLITGSEFRLQDLPGLLVLLAPNRDAYAALSQLITRARRRCAKGHYQAFREDLFLCQHHCLALWQPGFSDDDTNAGQWLRSTFGRHLWLMAERPLAQNDQARNQWLATLAETLDCTIVATGHALMHRRERKPLQDLLTAIRLGTTVENAGLALEANGERYLRPLKRLQKLFPAAWLEESLRVAQQCQFSPAELRYEYPAELVPKGHTPSSWLRTLVHRGEKKRFPEGTPASIRKQLEKELALIEELAYEPFFLTIEDVVAFARQHGILCQGRGSAANSVVCYCLEITEVDPRRINLLLERFISRERNEPPDIDVDFEHERREEVIQYIYQKYGRERAALAATVICYRPRSALRDAGKALGLDPLYLEQLFEGIDWRDREDGWQQQLARKGLADARGSAGLLLPLARELLGFPRHLSQHVGGFVIAAHRIADLVPVENAAMAERTVIQWDKDDLEALGLLKVDVLALGMLTAIRRTLALVSQYRGRPLGLADIPPEDPAVYAMLQKGQSMGVFQVESRAQMSMLPRLRPACYYDLVVEVAIVRPGPIQGDMVHPYLKRRKHPERVHYPNERIRAILEPTLGVPIFQEQVIRLAMAAAGFSAGEADRLRRAMAAWKKHGDLSPFRQKLLQGMRERGYSEAFAEQLYRQMMGFGGYGFPEAHAASFALLVYVSAWLKHHEPAAFLCGLLNSQPMGFYSPSQLIQEARRQGVRVLPVDVNESTLEHRLTPAKGQGQPTVRLGLCIIRQLRRQAAHALVAARPEQGYRSIQDLRRLAGLSTADLEALAGGGALRSLSRNRYQARWDILAHTPGLELAGGCRVQEDPSDYAPDSTGEETLPEPDEADNLIEDYASLGLSLARHPMALLREQGRLRHCLRATELADCRSGQPVRVAGLVTGRQRPGSAKGVTFVTLEDETGNINVIVWTATARAQRQPLLKARLMHVRGVVEQQEGVIHVIAGRMTELNHLIDKLSTESRDFR